MGNVQSSAEAARGLEEQHGRCCRTGTEEGRETVVEITGSPPLIGVEK
jgi:hypothetical protein